MGPHRILKYTPNKRKHSRALNNITTRKLNLEVKILKNGSTTREEPYISGPKHRDWKEGFTTDRIFDHCSSCLKCFVRRRLQGSRPSLTSSCHYIGGCLYFGSFMGLRTRREEESSHEKRSTRFIRQTSGSPSTNLLLSLWKQYAHKYTADQIAPVGLSESRLPRGRGTDWWARICRHVRESSRIWTCCQVYENYNHVHRHVCLLCSWYELICWVWICVRGSKADNRSRTNPSSRGATYVPIALASCVVGSTQPTRSLLVPPSTSVVRWHAKLSRAQLMGRERCYADCVKNSHIDETCFQFKSEKNQKELRKKTGKKKYWENFKIGRNLKRKVKIIR